MAHALRGDVLDAGLGVKAVGDDADLGAGEADGLFAKALDGHGHEGDGDLLAGRQQHVHLAGRRMIADFAGQVDQLIGGVAAGADDDDDLVPACLARMARRAARMIRSAVATLLPPNFCTTKRMTLLDADSIERSQG